MVPFITTFGALLVVLLVVWLTTRRRRGPRMSREDWSLYRDPKQVAVAVRVDELLEPLRRWGYQPELAPVVDGGPQFARLRHEPASHGSLVIDLRHLTSLGYATVEAHDVGDELYSEMARYVLFELGKLLPGSTYREAYSPLTAELTDTLEPQLPERPHNLPR
ncbi:MAG: hypothetical protein ABI321_11135 [Polyangia bacterium]